LTLFSLLSFVFTRSNSLNAQHSQKGIFNEYDDFFKDSEAATKKA